MEIDELRRIAAKEELSLNYLAKDEMISKILLKLQNFDQLILKGGTALNRVYLRNKRFSEDIDFDFIFHGTVKDAIPLTRDIVLNLDGFEVAKPRVMNQTIRYDLFYINPLRHKDRIMLEFRIIKKASNYEKKIVNAGFVPSDSSLLNVYNVEEIIKQKIECLLSRFEGKDIFDVYYLLDVEHKQIQLNKEAVLKKLSVDEKEIRTISNTINHYIPRNQRPDWNIFIQQLKEKIRLKL